MVVSRHVTSVPPITIGVPMRNASATISQALEALLRQEYPDLRIIVADNASTDDSLLRAREAIAGDPRVVIVEHATDIGAYANFNFLLSRADTPYFAWAAADDWADRDYYRVCVSALEARPDAVLAHGDADEQIVDETTPFMRHVGSCGYQKGVVARYRDVQRHFPDLHVYGVFRTEIGRAVGGMDEGPAGDITFTRRMALRGPFCHVAGTMHHRTIAAAWKGTAADGSALAQRPRGYARPSTHILRVSLRDIRQADLRVMRRGILSLLVLGAEGKRRVMVVLVRGCRIFAPITRSRRIATAVHRRFFAKGTYEVLDEETYLRRIVRPVLGWDK